MIDVQEKSWVILMGAERCRPWQKLKRTVSVLGLRKNRITKTSKTAKGFLICSGFTGGRYGLISNSKPTGFVDDLKLLQLPRHKR